MSKLLQSGEHPDADQLSAFVDHALPQHEREEVLAHLAECADCRETVALSLPPIEGTLGATGTEKGKPWFWGMRLVWSAAVVAGLTVALFYIHHAASSHKGPNATGPMVASELSTPSAKIANVPAPSTANSNGYERQSERKKQPRLAVSPPRAAEEPPRAPSAGGGGGGASSFAGQERETSANAQQAQATASSEEKPQTLLRSGANLGRLADDKTQRVAELHLPAGAAAISAVTRGQQVLAIDARSEVFLSNDGGGAWTAIRIPWNGRAVRAELISYSANSVSLGKSSAADMGRGSGSGAGADATAAVNSSDAARFAAQKSLKQELKRNYPAALNEQAPASPIAAPRSAVGPQGSLTGVVTDRAGAFVARARVVVTDPANHATKSVETDDKGQYRVDGLAPGAYALEAEAPGFKTATVSPLQVAASTPNVTNLTLDVGSAAQTVTVQAAPTGLQTSSPRLDSAITPQTGKSTSPIIMGQPAPVFEITTDTGDHWTSADGVNWRRQ